MWWLDWLVASLRLSTPLLFAATGGVISERAGVIALHLEAVLLAGAWASTLAAQATGNVWAGIGTGIVAGALIGLLHGFLTQALRVSHILSGVALNLGLLGFTTFALRQAGGSLSTTASVSPWVLTALALFSVGLAWFVLMKTALGLRIRSLGENPRAARSAGLSVTRLRYGALAISGALTGLGGVALTLTGLGEFTENMTAGRGYIALAAVIFGRWDVRGAALAALLFGAGEGLQLSLQTAGLSEYVPPDILGLLPYVLTLIALTVMTGKTRAPAALGDTNA
ncbi:MAG: ABC transporter permease [Armatimonadaceae bacterium]